MTEAELSVVVQVVLTVFVIGAGMAVTQINAAGHEPFAKSVALSVGAIVLTLVTMAVGRSLGLFPMRWVFNAHLAAVLLYLVLIAVRLTRLYERKDRDDG